MLFVTCSIFQSSMTKFGHANHKGLRRPSTRPSDTESENSKKYMIYIEMEIIAFFNSYWSGEPSLIISDPFDKYLGGFEPPQKNFIFLCFHGEQAMSSVRNFRKFYFRENIIMQNQNLKRWEKVLFSKKKIVLTRWKCP